jgi:membrane-bound lytic murein transglycosylase B
MLALVWLAAFAVAGDWDEVAAAAGMSVAEAQRLASGAQMQQSVLDRMSKPWEAKPWHQYAPIFLNEARIEAGVAFWAANTPALEAATARTGVPPEIILAIIGVETKFGQVMGADRVLDSLFTLGFHHPKRGPYFRKELGNYLRLCVDEGWEPGSKVGSYAGAMGYGQFMPSSYRNYAVDGDADGKRDLFGSPADAIASVANYFAGHGWKAGELVLLPATVGGDVGPFLSKDLKPSHTWGQLTTVAATPTPPPAGAPARLFVFETEQGPEYRIGLHNFYVITRYNHSAMYARAVHDLAAGIRQARQGEARQGESRQPP